MILVKLRSRSSKLMKLASSRIFDKQNTSSMKLTSLFDTDKDVNHEGKLVLEAGVEGTIEEPIQPVN